MKTLVLSLLACGIVMSSWAATIPAGTTVLMKTSRNIYSGDPAGRRFEGVLARSIAVGGNVVVPAGTHLRGVVKSPKFSIGSTSRPLTLRLTEIVVHGRPVAVKSEDLEGQSNSPWTVGPRRVQVTGGAFVYTPGTILPFRLKHAVEI